jgi:hypothetical protein
MSSKSAQENPLEQAYLLVGRFLHHFALVEQKIDQAIIKLLRLDSKCAPMVGLLDFVKKVDDLVRVNAVSQTKDKEFVNNVCNRAHTVNGYRRIVAHASFKPAPDGGVLFSRAVTAKGSVRPVSDPWTNTDFARRYAEMTALEADLDKLIQLIKPLPQSRSPFLEMYYRSSLYPGAAIAKLSEMKYGNR